MDTSSLSTFSCLVPNADATDDDDAVLVKTCQEKSSSSQSATAAELVPEIKHPLLRRHFFTIGIGDCFVQPPPAHIPLPSVYLASSTSSSSCTTTTAERNYNFESTELVAAIKSTPQDFVVREISLPHRIIFGLNQEQVESSLRVASLETLPNCSNSNFKNNYQPTIVQRRRCHEAPQAMDSLLVDGEFNSKNDDGLSLSFEATTVDETEKNARKYSSLQKEHTNTAVQHAAAAAASASASALDPMSTLQKFLPPPSLVDAPTISSRSLDDLSRLQADALNWIQKRASSRCRSSNVNNQAIHNDNNTYTEDILSKSVVIQPLLSLDPGSSSNTARLERGEFHTALRIAFPLLKVKSTETKSSLSSSCVNESSSSCNNNIENSTDIPTDVPIHSYYRVKVMVDDSFFGLIPYLYEPHVDLPCLFQFLRNKHTDSSGDERRHRPLVHLRLRPDLGRSERRPIHQIIDSKSGRSLSTETLPGYSLHPDHKDCSLVTAAIVVSWSKTAQRRAAAACKSHQSKKRKRGPVTIDNDKEKMIHKHNSNDNFDSANDQTTPSVDHNSHILFILKKTQVEHLAAVQMLSKALHCRQPDIGLSGIKDMHAVTYQFCTIRRNHAAAVHSPSDCIIPRHARDFLHSRGIEISQNVYKVNWHLQKGALQGNRFEIVLRNVRRIQVVSQPTATAATAAATESFFPCDTAYIQEAVKRIETFGILNFYGEQRVGAAGDKELVGTRALDIGRAMLQQNYTKAIDLIMTGRLLCKGGTELECDELRLVRQTWKASGGDPVATWKVLPPSESSLLLRERLVLRGLKRHGTSEPLAALKCLQYNERVFWIQAYQSYVFNRAVTERVQRYGCSQVVPGDLVRSRQHGAGLSSGSTSSDSEPPVLIVTERNLTDYSIDDVVLPLPGYNSVYPTNKVGALYQAILEADQIVFRKDSLPATTTAKGTYRSLKASVTNVKSEILNRDDDSGLDLRIWFDLPAGSYATMVLRELMRTTVSRSNL